MWICGALLGGVLATPSLAVDSIGVQVGTPSGLTTGEHSGVGLRDPGDVTLGSVIIEAEPITEPTIDELMRGFRDALNRDRMLYPGDIVERQFASGMLQVNTRYGLFCFAPLPAFLAPTITTGTNLVSRCASY
jgi:hypothetical protein